METTIPAYQIKQTKNLSPRIQWLRDYYFQGVKRRWNNEYTSWTTGTDWDFQYEEASFHIVPETYSFLKTFRSLLQTDRHAGSFTTRFLVMVIGGTACLVCEGSDGQLPASGNSAG